MGLLRFVLKNKNSEDEIFSSNSFLSVFEKARNTVNEPRNWVIVELENEEEVDSANLFYLVENFTPETLPLTITNIQ